MVMWCFSTCRDLHISRYPLGELYGCLGSTCKYKSFSCILGGAARRPHPEQQYWCYSLPPVPHILYSSTVCVLARKRTDVTLYTHRCNIVDAPGTCEYGGMHF